MQGSYEQGKGQRVQVKKTSEIKKEMSEKRPVTFEDVETNVLFMMSLSMDLMLRDLDRKMKFEAYKLGTTGGFKHEKKMQFKRFTEAVRTACYYAEQLGNDVIVSTEKSNYKDLNIWQAESNELARLVLLYADKSSEEGATESIFGYLSSFKGAGIITEDKLKPFYLK